MVAWADPARLARAVRQGIPINCVSIPRSLSFDSGRIKDSMRGLSAHGYCDDDETTTVGCICYTVSGDRIDNAVPRLGRGGVALRQFDATHPAAVIRMTLPHEVDMHRDVFRRHGHIERRWKRGG
jgi:hypothetical protein